MISAIFWAVLKLRCGTDNLFWVPLKNRGNKIQNFKILILGMSLSVINGNKIQAKMGDVIQSVNLDSNFMIESLSTYNLMVENSKKYAKIDEFSSFISFSIKVKNPEKCFQTWFCWNSQKHWLCQHQLTRYLISNDFTKTVWINGVIPWNSFSWKYSHLQCDLMATSWKELTLKSSCCDITEI